MVELQLVVFNLNNEVCGVDTTQVKQIVKYQEVTKMPKMPRFVDGVISLRGQVVPVISLNKRFELGETEITRKTKILITQIDKHLVGFIVNDVTELIKLSEDEIETLPDLIHKAGNVYLKSVGKKEDKIIAILDLNCILTDSEIKKIKQ